MLLREGTEAFFLEMFETFVEPLERELELHSTHTIGRSHAIRVNSEDYKNRIEAINFTLAHDDGQSAKGLAGRGRHSGRSIALRQNADESVPGDAVRCESRQLSADT